MTDTPIELQVETAVRLLSARSEAWAYMADLLDVVFEECDVPVSNDGREIRDFMDALRADERFRVERSCNRIRISLVVTRH